MARLVAPELAVAEPMVGLAGQARLVAQPWRSSLLTVAGAERKDQPEPRTVAAEALVFLVQAEPGLVQPARRALMAGPQVVLVVVAIVMMAQVGPVEAERQSPEVVAPMAELPLWLVRGGVRRVAKPLVPLTAPEVTAGRPFTLVPPTRSLVAPSVLTATQEPEAEYMEVLPSPVAAVPAHLPMTLPLAPEVREDSRAAAEVGVVVDSTPELPAEVVPVARGLLPFTPILLPKRS